MGWLSTSPTVGDYLRAVNGMPDFGQGSGWTSSDWNRAPVRSVRISSLTATNRGGYLSESRLARYAKPGWFEAKPCVVSGGGRLYIADGHHRCIAALIRGDSHIRARVIEVRK